MSEIQPIGHDLVTFGETMIRLTSPVGQRLEDTETVRVTIGGAESNVAVALARLGRRVAWLSVLPDNALGRRVDRELRGHGVDTSRVIWSSTGRAGVYFIEQGSRPRPTRVLYDRADSAMARVDRATLDPRALDGARALHLTGITPALSEACAAACDRLARDAADAGVPLSFDVNYRSRLWSADDAAHGIAGLLDRATVLFCGASDAATIWGLRGEADDVARRLLDRSSAELIVLTLADAGAVAVTRDGRAWRQAALPVDTIDPVGAGDAFAAGFLHRWLDDHDAVEAALRSATALAALKLTMNGDLALITASELDEAIALLDDSGDDIVR